MWFTNGVGDEYDSSSNNIINTSDSDNERRLERESWKWLGSAFFANKGMDNPCGPVL